MLKKDCFQLGHISKKHSFKGEVIFHLDTDQPERYENLESVLVDVNGNLIPFFMEQTRLMGNNKLRVKFEDVNNEQEANHMIGAELFLPLAALPPLSGKKFYFHEVIGYTAIDNTHGDIGIIEDVLDDSAQLIFLIKKEEQEILVPAIDEFIDRLDRKVKVVYLNTPEGLLDIYTSHE